MTRAAAPASETFSSDRLTAFLDSNVLIDAHSIHNITATPSGDLAANEMRVARARDALLLSICFYEMRALTYSLYESLAKTVELVPPGRETAETHYTTCVIHFVRPVALARWDLRYPNDVDPRKSEADRFLVDRAVEFGKPLITHDGGMTRKARARGVDVFTPAQFCAGRMNEMKAVRRFLWRYRTSMRPFARKMKHAEEWATLLGDIYEAYAGLLAVRRTSP